MKIKVVRMLNSHPKDLYGMSSRHLVSYFGCLLVMLLDCVSR